MKVYSDIVLAAAEQLGVDGPAEAERYCAGRGLRLDPRVNAEGWPRPHHYILLRDGDEVGAGWGNGPWEAFLAAVVDAREREAVLR